MAVNPLDLQTNFMQVSTVGKKQALAKEQEVLRQDHASEHLNKAGEKNADDVPETKKLSEEEKVKNDKEKNKDKKKDTNKKEQIPNEDESENEEKINDTVGLKKPGIGENIDLFG